MVLVNVPLVHPDWVSRAGSSGLYVIGAFMEEFLWRGYMFARIQELFGRVWIALLVTSGLFAVYHIYEGVGSAITVFFVGLVYGIVRVASGSVYPSTVAHACYNTILLFARVSW